MSPLFLRRKPKKVPTKQDNSTQIIAFMFRLLNSSERIDIVR